MTNRSRRILAIYLIETPLAPTLVADVIADENSSGTSVRLAGGPELRDAFALFGQ